MQVVIFPSEWKVSRVWLEPSTFGFNCQCSSNWVILTKSLYRCKISLFNNVRKLPYLVRIRFFWGWGRGVGWGGGTALYMIYTVFYFICNKKKISMELNIARLMCNILQAFFNRRRTYADVLQLDLCFEVKLCFL